MKQLGTCNSLINESEVTKSMYRNVPNSIHFSLKAHFLFAHQAEIFQKTKQIAKHIPRLNFAQIFEKLRTFYSKM